MKLLVALPDALKSNLFLCFFVIFYRFIYLPLVFVLHASINLIYPVVYIIPYWSFCLIVASPVRNACVLPLLLVRLNLFSSSSLLLCLFPPRVVSTSS